jgi:hypothetical protein
VDNRGCEGSLWIGKVYRVVKPATNLRVIDEEGEDYLYSAQQFVPIDLPPRAKRAVIAAY